MFVGRSDWPRSALYRETTSDWQSHAVLETLRNLSVAPLYRSMNDARFDDRPPSRSLPPSNPHFAFARPRFFPGRRLAIFLRSQELQTDHQFIPPSPSRRRLTNRILTSNFELSRTLKPPLPSLSLSLSLLYPLLYLLFDAYSY